MPNRCPRRRNRCSQWREEQKAKKWPEPEPRLEGQCRWDHSLKRGAVHSPA